MITVRDLEPLLFSGGTVVGDDGRKIGSLGQLFLDAATGHPAWVTVATGLFGRAESFIPMAGAELHGTELHVPYGRDLVKHAPRIESAEGHLSPSEERELYRHYGLLHDEPDDADHAGPDAPGASVASVDGTSAPGPAGPPTVPDAVAPTNAPAPLVPTSPGPPPRAVDDDPSLGEPGAAAPTGGPTAASVGAAATAPPTSGALAASTTPVPDGDTSAVAAAPAAVAGMVLPAEQAGVVGTERVPTERVRMHRYPVTEQEQITVPVQREEVRVEYEPAPDGVLPDLSPQEAPADRAVDPTRPGQVPGEERPHTGRHADPSSPGPEHTTR